MTRFLLACSALLLCTGVVARTTAAGPETDAALQATNYIRTLQLADGGFPDFSDSSTPSATLEAVFAFAAAGIDARTVEQGSAGPDDYLATQAAAYSAASPGGAAKLVAGLAAMDIDPTSFGGINPLQAMEANYDGSTGKYGDDTFAQALFILAERSLSRPVPAAAVSYLVSLQQADGGWEFCCGFGSDTNSTAIALRALMAAGTPTSDPSVLSAVAYLHSQQAPDGGFPYAAPFESDANSTAYVIQAIIALGQSAETGGPWDLGNGANPLAKLLSFQNPATGALVAFGADSPFATYQGVPGLMLDAFPEQAAPDDYTPTPATTSTQSPTATPSATHTATPTATARPSTPTATASAVASAPTSGPANATPTEVNSVLAATPPPPRTGVAALPSTGQRGDGADPLPAGLALASTGVALLAAGLAPSRKRRSGPTA